jgi:peptidoglycan/LPS O-acetylase OafA/YrhL
MIVGQSVSTNKSRATLRTLQALRAVAAWLVVIDHALLSLTFNDPKEPLSQLAYTLGNAGVYTFFTISGFIMTHISWDEFGRVASIGQFLRRRIIRIVPLYWLATFAAVGFHQLAGTRAVEDGLSQIWMSLLFIPYQDQSGVWAPILAQGWTLSYEVMFYILFALALSLHRRYALPALAVGLLALTSAGPWLSPGVLVHLASPIVLWFVLGIALAVIWHVRSLSEPAFFVKRLRPLQFFGNASYSIYLVHGLALTLLFRVWRNILGPPPIWYVPVACVFATLVGCLVHVLVEKPLIMTTQKAAGGVVAVARGFNRRFASM